MGLLQKPHKEIILTSLILYENISLTFFNNSVASLVLLNPFLVMEFKMKYLINDKNQVIRYSDGYIMASMGSREAAVKLASMLG